MSDSITDVMEPVPGEPLRKPKSDLGVRTLSAVVMIAVTGAAFWADGWTLLIFLGLIGVGLLWEFWGLVRRFVQSVPGRAIWMTCGAIYFGMALTILLTLTLPFFGWGPVSVIIGSIIATDVGAYFAGRSIGGPKIAPSISPSKTWAGLIGGMCAAALTFAVLARQFESIATTNFTAGLLMGAGVAIVAQAGDFFQSWMKRRAGVKDSGNLIPGHGGLFDRFDGFVAVFFVAAIFYVLYP